MPKTFEDWKPLAHAPVEKLSENLWRVVGTLPGMSLRRVMTIARLQDGRLVIHSAVALEEGAMKDMEAWGQPAFLIVPNGYHRRDALAYKSRYASIRVLAPKGSRAKIETAVAVDATYDAFPEDDTVRFEMISGIGDKEGAMLVRSGDGVTLVLNDIVFNMDRRPDPLGFLITSALGSAPGPRVSRLAKLLMVKDKAALRAQLERFADMPDLARLVVSHDKLEAGRDNAAAALRKAANFL